MSHTTLYCDTSPPPTLGPWQGQIIGLADSDISPVTDANPTVRREVTGVRPTLVTPSLAEGWADTAQSWDVSAAAGAGANRAALAIQKGVDLGRRRRGTIIDPP